MKRSARIVAAPLLVFGLGALLHLLHAQRAPKSPASLVEHLADAGIAVVIGEPWELAGVGDLCWTLQCDEQTFTLRQTRSVLQADIDHEALTQNAQDFPVNLYYGSFEVYRNGPYLLELVGKGDARSARVGAAFENW